MKATFTAAPPPPSLSSPPRFPAKFHQRCWADFPREMSFSNLKLNSIGSQKSARINLRRNSSTGNGQNERTVLDAFFLGKALIETIGERFESSVGEFLSVIGMLKAEQQKKVQEFQEEVLERAKRAKEQLVREVQQTLEIQGVKREPSAADTLTVNGVAATTSPSPTSAASSSASVSI